MAWLGEGFSTLKDQITNFTKEVKEVVLSDGKDNDAASVLETRQPQDDYTKAANSGYLQNVLSDPWNSWTQAEFEPVDVLPASEESLPLGADMGNSKTQEQYLKDEVARLEAEKRVMMETCRDLQEQNSELNRQLHSSSAKKEVSKRLEQHSGDSNITQEELTDSFLVLNNGYEINGEPGPRSLSASPNSMPDSDFKIGSERVPLPHHVCSEQEKLRAEKQCLASELQAMASSVQDLEAKMTKLLEENATLSTSLEELDSQHQIVIDKLLGAKTNLSKENEALTLELATLRSRIDTMSETRSFTDKSINTLESLEVNCSEREAFDDKGSESDLQFVNLDMPQEQSGGATANSEHDSMTQSIVEVSVGNKWKEGVPEDHVAEIMKTLQHTQMALKERDETVNQMCEELSVLKEREAILIGELEVAQSNNVCQLSTISDNIKEVGSLQSRISMLEVAMEDYNHLKAELDRLTEERTAIERQVHFAEASLNNEENYQRTTGHELQQALQANAEIKRENHLLQNRIEELQAVEKNYEKLNENYVELKDQINRQENELKDALNKNASLEGEIKCKEDRLQLELNSNKELLDQNRAHLITINSQVDLINQYKHMEGEFIKFQESIAVKDKELHIIVENKCHLESELKTLSERFEETMKAKADLETQLVSLVNQLRNQQVVDGNKDVELSELEKRLIKMQSELDGALSSNSTLKSDTLSLSQKLNSAEEANLLRAQQVEELMQIKSKLEMEIQHCSEKCFQLEHSEVSLRNEILNLESKNTELLKTNSSLSEQNDSLLTQSQKAEFDSNRLEEIEELQKEVYKLKEVVLTTEHMLSEALQARAELEAECKRLCSIERKVEGQENLQDEVSRLTTLIEELQADRSRLLDQLQEQANRHVCLQNEIQEQHESENSHLRELERLRLHLVTVEDTYTQELVTNENKIRDLQGKLAAAEERIKVCNNALTSASVRANQHVETLQGQARLIGQQRDDIQGKLSAAEDQIQRHAAALINLQAVLEQFQRDKEDEVASAKIPLERKLASLEERMGEQNAEISALKNQLTEAKNGLDAAARLDQQLDEKTHIIAELTENVERLQGLLNTAEKREESASSSAEGKVDKMLLKNLVLGYLSAPDNSKLPALRILTTVLDFNEEERGRAGLDPGSSGGGWLHKLLHPGPDTASRESLSESFIRFLESESRPLPQLKLLPAIQEEEHSRRRSDTPVPVGRSPSLLTDVQLPTFTQFPVARSSSSILKDVLNSS